VQPLKDSSCRFARRSWTSRWRAQRSPLPRSTWWSSCTTCTARCFRR
jgi:hypothetical protein